MALGIKELVNKKRNRLFLIITIWLIIGIFTTAFYPGIGLFIIIFLIPFCISLFVISLFSDVREIGWVVLIIIFVVTIFLAFTLILFQTIILFLFEVAIVSYIIITAIFSLYGCYEGSKSVDKYIYQEFPKPLHQITRGVEFIVGLFLGIYFIYWIFLFSGSILVLVTWIIVITLLILAGISLIFLFAGKFNAWLGMFAIYASLYFAYLVIAFVFGAAIFGVGTNSILAKVIFAILDVMILLYTIGILVGKRAEILSDNLKVIKPETILMWLLFSKAAYELGKLIDPSLISVKNWWVLIIFICLLGIVGFVGILKYKKYRKSKK